MRIGFVALSLALGLPLGCSSNVPDRLRGSGDGGQDASRDGAVPDTSPPSDATSDGSQSDALVGRPCTTDGQCDDGISCTFDSCDPALGRCRHTADHSLCDDGVYCNGSERCSEQRGCVAGPPQSCSSLNPCAFPRCDETTRSCVVEIRDLDGDGALDYHCATGTDCDDSDPRVGPGQAEVCGNGKDDNCDGRIDEEACVVAAGDSCSSPLDLVLATRVSLAGARRDHSASCFPASGVGRDAVLRVVIPDGFGPRDLDIKAVTSGDVALSLVSSCDGVGPSLACSPLFASRGHLRARSLSPGTYYLWVLSNYESVVDLYASMDAPTEKPDNESCNRPLPLPIGRGMPFSLSDATRDLPSQCGMQVGELTYRVDLTETVDLTVRADVEWGVGIPVLGLRTAACVSAESEQTCRSSPNLPLVGRSLSPGRYVITLGSSLPIDGNLLAVTSTPTAVPADQSCSSSPPLIINETTSVSLAGRSYAIQDGCMPGYANAAFALPLPVTSDVLLLAKTSSYDVASLALDGVECTQATSLFCQLGSGTVFATKRGVPAGDYRVVIGDMSGIDVEVAALVRPTTQSLLLEPQASCSAYVTVAAEGAFLAGDTASSTPAMDQPCDAAGQPSFGAPEQVFRLDLPVRRRVVALLQAQGWTPVLSVRSGSVCPGQTVPSGCIPGFSAGTSLYDRELDAGTYWVVVDGYNQARGPWTMDLRTLSTTAP